MKVLDCKHPFHAGLGITCHASRLGGGISYSTPLHQSKGLYAKYGTKLFIFWKDFGEYCLEKDTSLSPCSSEGQKLATKHALRYNCFGLS